MLNNVYFLPEIPYMSIFWFWWIESACIFVISLARNDSFTGKRQTGNNQNRFTCKKREVRGEFQKLYGIHCDNGFVTKWIFVRLPLFLLVYTCTKRVSYIQHLKWCILLLAITIENTLICKWESWDFMILAFTRATYVLLNFICFLSFFKKVKLIFFLLFRRIILRYLCIFIRRLVRR